MDTGEVRALVRLTVPGGVCERAINRDVVLDQALAGANFDRQKTLRHMADEGVLEGPAGRGFTR